MNAYELAKDLEKYYALNKQFPDTVEKVVAMLRQLADENKSLRSKYEPV
jgi:hypothetical protein